MKNQIKIITEKLIKSNSDFFCPVEVRSPELKEGLPSPQWGNFVSNYHFKKHIKGIKNYKCSNCYKNFIDTISSKRVFCSIKCKLNFYTGKPRKGKAYWSLEAREKARKRMLGKKLSFKTLLKLSVIRKGKPSGTKGYKYTLEQRKKISALRRGKNAHRYIDGRTTVSLLIRGMFEYKQWINFIFRRDNYICQECKDSKGGNLNAHHIKPFSVILQEFLQQYPQFSPIEDKETLVRLAITYEPFWNIDNGKTLCERCHKKQNFKRLEVNEKWRMKQ